MRYVGIDISLVHTAMVCINADGTVSSMINNLGYSLPNDASPWQYTERDDVISSGVYHYCLQQGVKLIGIEGYSFASGGQSVLQIAELIGVVRFKLASVQKLLLNLPIFIPPTSLKKFATGKGNADKNMMANAAEKKPWEYKHEDDNVIDAYWLAQMMRYADKSIRSTLPALIEPKIEALKTIGLW